MPSGSSIRRLAKYSHDTAEGCADAMIAPPTTSHCGPALAIMPGTALAKKPRIGASNAMRSGVAMRWPPGRNTSTSNCTSPAIPTVAAITSAACAASVCREDQPDHHRDQRDVEQQRRERRQREAPLRVQQRHHHRGGAREGEVRQHQPGVVDGEPQRVVSGKARRQRGDEIRHRQRDHGRGQNQRSAHGAEHAAGERGRGDRAFALAHAPARPAPKRRSARPPSTAAAPH